MVFVTITSPIIIIIDKNTEVHRGEKSLLQQHTAYQNTLEEVLSGENKNLN